MEITRTSGDGSVRLALRGRFDAAWSAHVQAALDACVRAGQHEIELDLAAVVFLSSAGIRVLLITHRQLRAIGGRLAIVDASPDVRQVIELSGLRALLAAAPVVAPEAGADAAPRQLARPNARYEIRALDPQARVAVRPLGDPAALLGGGALAGGLLRQSFPAGRIAVGVGAFGSDVDGCRERLGELLAVGGAAITLPTGGEGMPDWLLCEARLVPDAHLAYGLVGDGAFAHQARFEADGSAGPLPLDALVAAALEIADADAVALAVVAEAAQFVGAALRRSPAGRARGVFSFPEIRDQLDFTAEPAHAGSVGIVAGFAARRPSAALAPHLRPIDRARSCFAHLHAAVFPYRPLRRDQAPLEETVRMLFESRAVLGLLHLLHDWRPGSGAGQTSLHRGALWCAPLTAAELQGADA
jgi:anti-anti-sigma factor